MTPEKDIKLHLGCGERYLDGYVNIDFPLSEHTLLRPRVDKYADFRTLQYPSASVVEIRAHHVFEHFNRVEALGLLLQWRRWLKPGGVLHLETPDFGRCAWYYVLSGRKTRMEIGRHVFGSQEAPWALHKDFWDKKKFLFVLGALGFRDIRLQRISNDLAGYFQSPFFNWIGMFLPLPAYKKFGKAKLPNITVICRKSGADIDERRAVREILSQYLTGTENNKLLEVWLGDVFRDK
ncbi:MAG: hypothetical protein AAB686_02080 [Patescibacteria group bacterium]